MQLADVAFSHKAILELVRHIIHWPRMMHWSVQGLGMVRAYLGSDRAIRLNIWNNELRLPDVSPIHDHPWDFASMIVAGRLQNNRYVLSDRGDKYNHVRILCGPGTTKTNMTSDVDSAHLVMRPPEFYFPGHIYRQDANEIHETKFEDGTITINQRILRVEDNKANVYWEYGPWVSAEPRAATDPEIEQTLVFAKRRLSEVT